MQLVIVQEAVVFTTNQTTHLHKPHEVRQPPVGQKQSLYWGECGGPKVTNPTQGVGDGKEYTSVLSCLSYHAPYHTLKTG